MREWFVDLEKQSAFLDLTQEDDLSVEEVELLLERLGPYYNEARLRSVVISVRGGRLPAKVEVLLNGARAQFKAAGVDFSVRYRD